MEMGWFQPPSMRGQSFWPPQVTLVGLGFFCILLVSEGARKKPSQGITKVRLLSQRQRGSD